MQLTPILIIFAILIHSEICSSSAVFVATSQWRAALSLIFLCLLSSWILALVESRYVRAATSTTQLRRLLQCDRFHLFMCLTVALAVEYGFHWSRFVRVNLGLGKTVLVDELAILTPLIVLLVGSWLASKMVLRRHHERACQNGWLYRSFFAFERMRASQLRQRIHRMASSANISLGEIWIWKTDHRNAIVMTIWPFQARIILTEGLLRSVDSDTTCMLVAHELGHVKRRHGLYRLAFALLPVFLWQECRREIGGAAFPTPAAEAAFHLAWFSLYMIWVFGPLCRRLEHSADLWACHFLSQVRPHASSQVIPQYASMLRKLHRHPTATSTATWLHPHLVNRIVRLTQASPV